MSKLAKGALTSRLLLPVAFHFCKKTENAKISLFFTFLQKTNLKDLGVSVSNVRVSTRFDDTYDTPNVRPGAGRAATPREG